MMKWNNSVVNIGIRGLDPKSKLECITKLKEIQKCQVSLSGILPEIQDPDGQGKVPNVCCPTHRMVHCCVVTTYLCPHDAVEDCVPNRRY